MFILGVKTQQRAAMWVDGEKVLEADASSSFCGTAGLSLTTARLQENSKLSVQYVPDEGTPVLHIIVYIADEGSVERMSTCSIDPGDDDLSPLPPGTIFTFGASGCEKGYEGSRCTLPVCESTCGNGGSCSAPDICVCPEAYGGNQCEDCAPGFLKIFGNCQRTSLIIIGGACIALVVAGALLTPKFKQYLELRSFSKFIQNELENGFDRYSRDSSMKWTTNALMQSQNVHNRRERFKDSSMWKLIATQSKPDLQMLKAHFISKKEIKDRQNVRVRRIGPGVQRNLWVRARCSEAALFSRHRFGGYGRVHQRSVDSRKNVPPANRTLLWHRRGR